MENHKNNFLQRLKESSKNKEIYSIKKYLEENGYSDHTINFFLKDPEIKFEFTIAQTFCFFNTFEALKKKDLSSEVPSFEEARKLFCENSPEFNHYCIDSNKNKGTQITAHK